MVAATAVAQTPPAERAFVDFEYTVTETSRITLDLAQDVNVSAVLNAARVAACAGTASCTATLLRSSRRLQSMARIQPIVQVDRSYAYLVGQPQKPTSTQSTLLEVTSRLDASAAIVTSSKSRLSVSVNAIR